MLNRTAKLKDFYREHPYSHHLYFAINILLFLLYSMSSPLPITWAIDMMQL